MRKAKNLFFLLISFIVSTTHPQNPPGNNQICTNKPTFTNSPTANPIFNNGPVNTKISPKFITNTTSTINAVGSYMRDITLSMVQKAQEVCTKKNYDHAKNHLQQLLWQYRYKLAIGTLLTAYSSICLLLITDYHYVKDAQRWSQWKSDCTFEYLCSMPQAELTQQLIHAIGEYHYNKKNPSDASHPLITFIEAIETEIKTCKRYLALAKVLQYAHLTFIFPCNNAKVNQVNAFLDRCLFIKHIFLSWLTERNLISRNVKINNLILKKTRRLFKKRLLFLQ